MILTYRPELENPPMAKEATIGFSFIVTAGKTEFVQLEAGVNRDVSDENWERIKSKNLVKRLMSLGALRVDSDDVGEEAIQSTPNVDSIAEKDVQTSLRLIEDSFDISQLQKWEASEKRIRVKNSINKRITAITEGKG